MQINDVKEFCSLVWTNLLVAKRNFVEWIYTACSYYKNGRFAKADLLLALTYLFDNPFTISKRFLAKRGESNLYQYGETPLTTLEKIMNVAGITQQDHLLELGCGRGKTCFWLAAYRGCQVTGVEYIQEFVERAEHVRKKCNIKNISFICCDMVDSPLNGVTCVYLYGSSLDEPYLHKLAAHLEQLPRGSKVITISYPITDYTASVKSFEIMHCFPALFTWGEADVYVQIRK